MSTNRIVYLNWIADLGHDPNSLKADPADGGQAGRGNAPEEIELAVEAAVHALDDNEREFVERYYYMGQSYGEIALASGREIHRLEGLRKRAMRKLKRALAGLVEERYGIKSHEPTSCPVCLSDQRPAADRLIAERDKQETWRPVIGQLRRRLGIIISSPQVLIGHEKYH